MEVHIENTVNSLNTVCLRGLGIKRCALLWATDKRFSPWSSDEKANLPTPAVHQQGLQCLFPPGLLEPARRFVPYGRFDTTTHLWSSPFVAASPTQAWMHLPTPGPYTPLLLPTNLRLNKLFYFKETNSILSIISTVEICGKMWLWNSKSTSWRI